MKINTGRIKSTLAMKGKTNEAAANEAGITQNKFRRILYEGKCDPISLGKIARVLGVEPWELVET